MTHRTVNPISLWGFAAVVVVCAQPVIGDVREFDTPNRDQWFANVTNIKTADFAEFRQFTVITDQYADLGVIFSNGINWVHTTTTAATGILTLLPCLPSLTSRPMSS